LVQARERVCGEAGEEISMAGIDSTAQGELHAAGSR